MDAIERSFNELVNALDYAMLIVTTASDDRRAGCLVGFATQCSIDPPRFLVCISEQNHTLRLARQSDALAVHFLSDDADELAKLFGSNTGDQIDKFNRCRWQLGPHGMPILEDCPRWFVGQILRRMTLGDHVGFLLSPLAAKSRIHTDQMPFQKVKHLPPGQPA